VPEPAKGVAEMARVVRPGGVIATYAWDLLGGGFPLEPIQAELRGMGISPVLPPSAPASRIEALRTLWTGAGVTAIETREISVQRTFANFDEFWAIAQLAPSLRPTTASHVIAGYGTAQGARARKAHGGCGRAHHLHGARQCNQGPQVLTECRARPKRESEAATYVGAGEAAQLGANVGIRIAAHVGTGGRNDGRIRHAVSQQRIVMS
jgi:hypothetical protein